MALTQNQTSEVNRLLRTVRAAEGRLSALRVSTSKSVWYGGFVWARGVLNCEKRRFSARAVWGAANPFCCVSSGTGSATLDNNKTPFRIRTIMIVLAHKGQETEMIARRSLLFCSQETIVHSS